MILKSPESLSDAGAPGRPWRVCPGVTADRTACRAASVPLPRAVETVSCARDDLVVVGGVEFTGRALQQLRVLAEDLVQPLHRRRIGTVDTYAGDTPHSPRATASSDPVRRSFRRRRGRV